MQGKIIKGIAGFYYVNIDKKGTFECKAKGSFRNLGKKPLVGDDVEIDIIDEEKKLGNVTKILDRKSEMIRPACANVDQALIIFAIKSPDPNFNLLDRFLIYMESENVPCIIVFNKDDLVSKEYADEIREAYVNAGYPMLFVSAKEDYGIDALKDILKHKTSVVAGPSGVGKSSLINKLINKDYMKTGSLSVKNERGKNTTRHAELLCIEESTYIMDTPGFTSLEVFGADKDNLKFYYNEFEPYLNKCKFSDCKHLNEPGCEVTKAVSEGKISKLRYDNYVEMLTELMNQKQKY
jgi:ribosome biogenesis GTPase